MMPVKLAPSGAPLWMPLRQTRKWSTASISARARAAWICVPRSECEEIPPTPCLKARSATPTPYSLRMAPRKAPITSRFSARCALLWLRNQPTTLPKKPFSAGRVARSVLSGPLKPTFSLSPTWVKRGRAISVMDGPPENQARRKCDSRSPAPPCWGAASSLSSRRRQCSAMTR